MDINPLLDVPLVNIFSQSVGCFAFCWLFPLLWIFFFFVWYVLLVCLFVYLSNLFSFSKEIYQEKILLAIISESVLLMFSSKSFMISDLTFKSLICFEFMLVYDITRWSSFIFCMYLLTFPNTIYWTDYGLLIVGGIMNWFSHCGKQNGGS